MDGQPLARKGATRIGRAVCRRQRPARKAGRRRPIRGTQDAARGSPAAKAGHGWPAAAGAPDRRRRRRAGPQNNPVCSGSPAALQRLFSAQAVPYSMRWVFRFL